MNYQIRELKPEEKELLDVFLYEAIFLPEGAPPLPKEVISQPELQIYIKNFGTCQGDYALVCEAEGKTVGVVWSRIMNDYGHIDNDTPSLAISFLKEYRGKGLGTKLLKQFLQYLKEKGYHQVSLSVQKQNYALSLYTKVGFKVVKENEEEYIMKALLQE